MGTRNNIFQKLKANGDQQREWCMKTEISQLAHPWQRLPRIIFGHLNVNRGKMIRILEIKNEQPLLNTHRRGCTISTSICGILTRCCLVRIMLILLLSSCDRSTQRPEKNSECTNTKTSTPNKCRTGWLLCRSLMRVQTLLSRFNAKYSFNLYTIISLNAKYSLKPQFYHSMTHLVKQKTLVQYTLQEPA